MSIKQFKVSLVFSYSLIGTQHWIGIDVSLTPTPREQDSFAEEKPFVKRMSSRDLAQHKVSHYSQPGEGGQSEEVSKYGDGQTYTDAVNFEPIVGNQ